MCSENVTTMSKKGLGCQIGMTEELLKKRMKKLHSFNWAGLNEVYFIDLGNQMKHPQDPLGVLSCGE